MVYMTINEYLRQKFPYFDVRGTKAWNENEDLTIRVRILNDHAVIEVMAEWPESCVTTTCDSTFECDIVDFLEDELDEMIAMLKGL